MILHNGDCLEFMRTLPDNSVDMCLTDPPYGTTACKWDSVIPFEPMWAELKRIVKDDGAIVLFGAEPFASLLRCSNLKMFKYDWFLNKDKATGFLNCKKQPLRRIEVASVFYVNQCLYNPILIDKNKKNIRPNKRVGKSNGTYGNFKFDSDRTIPINKGYPQNLINIDRIGSNSLHPTQKPVALLEYLIKTYTLENETVLDFTMGSGSTGVACVNTNRKFIGCELDESYFNIALERINGRIG